MEFKVGDKVKNKKYGYGKVVKVWDDGTVRVQYDNTHDDLHSAFGDCPPNTAWNYDKNKLNQLELALTIKPTKQELLDMPVGTKIYTDAENENYKVWIKVVEEDFTNGNSSYINNDNINNDLTLNEYINKDYGTKIIKIEQPTYETVYDYSTEVQEMTVAEIEKALGHAVKIIKEDNQ